MQHYLIIRGEVSEWFFFRDIHEVRRFLSENDRVELSEMRRIADMTEDNGDIFVPALVDGERWELHQSEPSEEPEGLVYYYS